MDSVIYYFTGTGNSYKVSKDIAQKLGERYQHPQVSLKEMIINIK
jgi:flavodoxin